MKWGMKRLWKTGLTALPLLLSWMSGSMKGLDLHPGCMFLPDLHPPGSKGILSPLQWVVARRCRPSPELKTLTEYSVAQTLWVGRQGRQAAPNKEPSGTLLGKMCSFSGVSTFPAGSRDGKKLWSPGDCPWKCGVRELGETISVSCPWEKRTAAAWLVGRPAGGLGAVDEELWLPTCLLQGPCSRQNQQPSAPLPSFLPMGCVAFAKSRKEPWSLQGYLINIPTFSADDLFNHCPEGKKGSGLSIHKSSKATHSCST